jgi:Zn-dependent protease
MRDVSYWSVSCGRGAEVDVRLHVSLFIAVAAVLHLGARHGDGESMLVALSVTIIYLLSLAAHEFAHAVTSWKRGGRIDCVVLGPVGGLTHLGAGLDSNDERMTALAGPAANFALAVIAVAASAATGHSVGSVLFPFAPPGGFFEFSLSGLLIQTAWINWLLVLVNVLPMFPFDGVRVASAVLRERFDEQAPLVSTARISLAASVVCLVASWFVPSEYDPASFLLTLLGIVGAFYSYVELRRAAEGDWEEASPYGDSASMAADERRPHLQQPGPLRRWWQRRQEAKLQLRLQIEREEEERADEILARLHDGGPQSLSPQDRALLERVSARYRQRH